MHRAATQRNEVQEDEEREEAFFKRYLEYCRAKVSPRLSEAAANSLVSQYVELREQVSNCSLAQHHAISPWMGALRKKMSDLLAVSAARFPTSMLCATPFPAFQMLR